MDIERWTEEVALFQATNDVHETNTVLSPPPVRPLRKKAAAPKKIHTCCLNDRKRPRATIDPDGISGDSLESQSLPDNKPHDYPHRSQPHKSKLCKESNEPDRDSSDEYKRRPRRKTRPDRYELKTNVPEKPSASQSKKKKSGTRASAKRRDKSGNGIAGVGKLPTAHVGRRITSLCPSRPRLSLPTREKYGSHNEGFTAPTRPGPPDLAVTDMGFLERNESKRCFCHVDKEDGRPNHEDRKDRKQLMQEEISSFFDDNNNNKNKKRVPLTEKDANAAQKISSVDRGKHAKNYPMKRRVPDVGAHLAEIKKPNLGSGSKSARLECSHFDWSTNGRSSSVSALFERQKSSALCGAIEYSKDRYQPHKIPKRGSVDKSGQVRTVSSLRSVTKEDSPMQWSTTPKRAVSPATRGREAHLHRRQRSLGDKIKQLSSDENGIDGLKRKRSLYDDTLTSANQRYSEEDNIYSRQAISSRDNHRKSRKNELQLSDNAQRSSSTLGRLLKECDDALYQRHDDSRFNISDAGPLNDSRPNVEPEACLQEQASGLEPPVLDYDRGKYDYYREDVDAISSHDRCLDEEGIYSSRSIFSGQQIHHPPPLHSTRFTSSSFNDRVDSKMKEIDENEALRGFWRPQKLY